MSLIGQRDIIIVSWRRNEHFTKKNLVLSTNGIHKSLMIRLESDKTTQIIDEAVRRLYLISHNLISVSLKQGNEGKT